MKKRTTAIRETGQNRTVRRIGIQRMRDNSNTVKEATDKGF
jgi:hypothetical protein